MGVPHAHSNAARQTLPAFPGRLPAHLRSRRLKACGRAVLKCASNMPRTAKTHAYWLSIFAPRIGCSTRVARHSRFVGRRRAVVLALVFSSIALHAASSVISSVFLSVHCLRTY